jgi:hypothetical protein
MSHNPGTNAAQVTIENANHPGCDSRCRLQLLCCTEASSLCRRLLVWRRMPTSCRRRALGLDTLVG